MFVTLGESIIASAHFTKDGVGVTGITVTVDIWKTSPSATTQIVTDGACTEIGSGLYGHTLAGQNVTDDIYWYVWKTDADVDQKNLAAEFRYISSLRSMYNEIISINTQITNIYNLIGQTIDPDQNNISMKVYQLLEQLKTVFSENDAKVLIAALYSYGLSALLDNDVVFMLDLVDFIRACEQQETDEQARVMVKNAIMKFTSYKAMFHYIDTSQTYKITVSMNNVKEYELHPGHVVDENGIVTVDLEIEEWNQLPISFHDVDVIVPLTKVDGTTYIHVSNIFVLTLKNLYLLDEIPSDIRTNCLSVPLDETITINITRSLTSDEYSEAP